MAIGEMVMATSKPCALFKLRLKGRGNAAPVQDGNEPTPDREKKWGTRAFKLVGGKKAD
jgi:hypothetical protein